MEGMIADFVQFSYAIALFFGGGGGGGDSTRALGESSFNFQHFPEISSFPKILKKS